MALTEQQLNNLAYCFADFRIQRNMITVQSATVGLWLDANHPKIAKSVTLAERKDISTRSKKYIEVKRV